MSGYCVLGHAVALQAAGVHESRSDAPASVTLPVCTPNTVPTYACVLIHPPMQDQAVFALLWQWDLTTAQLLAAVREQHQLQARRWATAMCALLPLCGIGALYTHPPCIGSTQSRRKTNVKGTCARCAGAGFFLAQDNGLDGCAALPPRAFGTSGSWRCEHHEQPGQRQKQKQKQRTQIAKGVQHPQTANRQPYLTVWPHLQAGGCGGRASGAWVLWWWRRRRRGPNGGGGGGAAAVGARGGAGGGGGGPGGAGGGGTTQGAETAPGDGVLRALQQRQGKGQRMKPLKHTVRLPFVPPSRTFVAPSCPPSRQQDAQALAQCTCVRDAVACATAAPRSCAFPLTSLLCPPLSAASRTPRPWRNPVAPHLARHLHMPSLPTRLHFSKSTFPNLPGPPT